MRDHWWSEPLIAAALAVLFLGLLAAVCYSLSNPHSPPGTLGYQRQSGQYDAVYRVGLRCPCNCFCVTGPEPGNCPCSEYVVEKQP